MERFSRQSVRALAEKHMAELLDTAKAGGNASQRSLDQRDQLKEMYEGWPEEDQTSFLNMYAEELDACAAHTQRAADEINAQTENKLQVADNIGQFIGAAILIAFIVFMFIMWK